MKVLCWGVMLTKQVVVGLALVFERQTTEADVVEVLEPLEVGHGDTSSVEEEIRKNENVLLQQDCVSLQNKNKLKSSYSVQEPIKTISYQ